MHVALFAGGESNIYDGGANSVVHRQLGDAAARPYRPGVREAAVSLDVRRASWAWDAIQPNTIKINATDIYPAAFPNHKTFNQRKKANHGGGRGDNRWVYCNPTLVCRVRYPEDTITTTGLFGLDTFLHTRPCPNRSHSAPSYVVTAPLFQPKHDVSAK